MESADYKDQLGKIQNIYDRTQIASSLNYILPEAAAFAEILFTSPLFNEFLETQKNHMHDDLAPLLKLKKAASKELEASIQLIEKHSEPLPLVQSYLRRCKSIESTTPTISWERACRQYKVIVNLCIVLRNSKNRLSYDTQALVNSL